MPGQLKLNKFFWALISLVIMITGFYLGRVVESGDIQLSSMSAPKRKYDFKNINVVGKHLAVIRSEIEAVQLPDQDSDVAILKATVYLNQAVDENLSYRLYWDSDMQVEPISGTEGELNGSAVGEVQTVEFRLRNFSHASKKVVTFLVESRQQGRQFGSTAIISSRPEDSMEYIAPAKMESAQQATNF